MATAPAECCPPGSLPALEEASQHADRGQTRTIGDNSLSVYEVGPQAAKFAVIVVHDVFGFSGGRIKGVCDTLSVLLPTARIVLPDIYGSKASIADFGGFAAPEGKEFLRRMGWKERTRPVLEAVLRSLPRADSGEVIPVGVLGFCWGLWPVLRACGDSELVELGVRCGSSAHPSAGVCALYGDDAEALAKAIKTPLQLLPAGNDADSVKEGGAVAQAVRETAKKKCMIRSFDDMQHGWVPRGDITDKTVARDVEAAVREVATFFSANL
jgi:dienelactone hydrolase